MREFEQRALLVVGEAHRFAGMHRQRQRIRAVAKVEFDEFLIHIEIDAAVAP